MAARLSVRGSIAELAAALVAALGLAACDHARSDTVQSLARDPQRLVVVLRQCRADPASNDDKLCRAASEAWRRRFFGNDRAHPSPSSTLRSRLPLSPPETEPTAWMGGS